MGLIITFINVTTQVITLLVIANVLLSYFMSPFHPVRQTLDRLVEPLLAPIRRIMPQTGMLDFSPLVLLILVQVVQRLLVSFLVSL